MFDLGWSELAVIALIALIVVGPKDLPQVLRTVGHWVRKARSMAREFQSSVDEMVQEADLEEARKTIASARTFDMERQLEEAVDPTGDVKEDMAQIQDAATRAAKGEDAPEAREDRQDPDAPPKAGSVVEQPHQMAPPHSVVPPGEPEVSRAAEEAVPEKTKSA